MTSSVTTPPTELNGTNRCDIDNTSSVIVSLDDPTTRLDDNTIDISITTSEVPSSVLQTVLPPTHTNLSTKAQVLPLVYIQTPSKLNKTNANSVIVNTMPQFQLSGAPKSTNLSQNIALSTVSGNQSVILTPVSNPGKTQQLLLQKSCNVQAVPVLPVSVSNTPTKFTGTYLTMLKPVTKPTDTKSIKINRSKSTDFTSPVTSANQKYVIAPMPKIPTNRLPVTATTNSVQPKIAFMPLINSNNNITSKKLFNFKLDGSENTPITVMCDSNTNGTDSLKCDEIISLESPKNEDKSYQLSITEETTTTAKNDVSFTITIPDEAHKIKPPPLKAKHGVSILKKSFSFTDRTKTDKIQQNSLIISPIPNSITTISDTSTKEVKITTGAYENDDPIIITEPKLQAKPERRRKSHFSYRKDYDEIEVTTATTDANMPITEKFSDLTVTKLPQSEDTSDKDDTIEDTVEIKLLQDESTAENILLWEDGIGTLPGTDVKFQKNEFGLLEMVTDDEYKRILEKRIARNGSKDPGMTTTTKKTPQEDLQCHQCGCYGLPSEFINTKYCSYDCQEVNNKNLKDTKLKKKKKKGFLKYPSNESPSDDDNSQDKFNYPWTCSKRGFSWAKYLDHIKAKGAPVKLFRDPFPYSRNGFRPGMKLEGIDPQHPSYFCVLSVAEVIGYRLRLHFDGYPDNYDFWVNADSMNIFPPGWCEKYGHILHPPPTYTIEDFNWNFYLKLTKSTPAPKHLFANRAGNAICPNGFRVGMKLEAVDRKNTSLVCVATITDMMDNRILVHFDSWDDIYDYWADPTSPYIHPVGWCDQFGHNLTPPNDYPNPEQFTWEKYLSETKSVPAPVRAFKQRQACGFKAQMRLECVDKRVPQLIRVATVDAVKDHQIRISFDGWPDRYSYWVDDDSTDIHPVGWCHKTGHPLEPPLTPDDVYDFLECATVGCRGQGHVMGPKFSTHSSQKDCPYADENIDQERVLPDRLLSPDKKIKAVVPISREPKEKSAIKITKMGRPAKIARMEWEDENEKKPKRKYIKKKFKNEPLEYDDTKKDLSLLINGYTTLPERQVWNKHSKYLEEYVRSDIDPREWTVDDVVDFVTSLPSCKDHGNLFSENHIDGEALLMLAQQDLVEILKIKLGPAIKLYNSIVMLRQNVKQFFT